jgi:uncharacterized protein (DUF2225 family)
MLEAWIIEQLKKKEKEEQEEQHIRLPLENELYDEEFPEEEPENKDAIITV